eukprot:COSAG01_NODE_10050_length_2262_cov_3.756819_2_plen_152_part_00
MHAPASRLRVVELTGSPGHLVCMVSSADPQYPAYNVYYKNSSNMRRQVEADLQASGIQVLDEMAGEAEHDNFAATGTAGAMPARGPPPTGGEQPPPQQQQVFAIDEGARVGLELDIERGACTPCTIALTAVAARASPGGRSRGDSANSAAN